MKILFFIGLFCILASCRFLLRAATETPAFTATLMPTPTKEPGLTATASPSPTHLPTAPQASPTLVPDPSIPNHYEQARRCGRGVNLGNALEAPREGEWGMVIQTKWEKLMAETVATIRRIDNRHTIIVEGAESLDIPWAYWEFGAGFGIYDRDLNRWNESLLHALIPD
ncbi:MAG: hypothetical protein P1S60_09550 [Anaerolineae bacterium]|nr:hypothetical protein [Anaerolineae bacterium]